MITATAAAAIIPITLGLDALRQTMFSTIDTGLFDPHTEMWWLFGMGAVFLYASIIIIDKLETIGRRDGKLILKND
jgi:hypothetical protein